MTINLSGELIPDDWAELYRSYGYNAGFFCPMDVRQAIGALSAGEELTLEINSVGGSVDGGSEIYSLIQACPNPTRAVIQSMAASAASYMIMSCDVIEICLPAQMMIHSARGGMSGTQADHLRDAQMLGCCDKSILSCYVARCQGKTDEQTLRAMMEAEAYIDSNQAVTMGLADRVITGAGADDGEPLVAASVATNLVRAMRVLPDIRVLKERRSSDQLAADRQELKKELLRYQNP